MTAWLASHPTAGQTDQPCAPYDADNVLAHSNTASHNGRSVLSDGTLTQASTRSSCNTRKAYKLNRSKARAAARRPADGADGTDEDSDADHDMTRRSDYVAHPQTRAILKQINSLTEADRRQLLTMLMNADRQFCPPPVETLPLSEPGAEPSPRGDAQVDPPSPAHTSLVSSDIEMTTAADTAAPAPAPDPKPEPEPTPMQVDDSDSSSSDTPLPPPPPPKRAHAVPHKARPASPKPPPPPPPTVPKAPPADKVGRGEWRGDPWVVFELGPPKPAAMPAAMPAPPPPTVPKAPPADFVGRGEWRGDTWVVFELGPAMPAAMPAGMAAPSSKALAFPNPWAAPAFPNPWAAATMPQPQHATSTPYLPPLPPLLPLQVHDVHSGVCVLCGKLDSWEHRQGRQHSSRELESQDLDALLGRRPMGLRRPLSSMALKGYRPATARDFNWNALQGHWGEDLASFPARALDRLRQRRILKIGKHRVAPQDISKIRLVGGFVPYDTQGRYGPDASFVPFTSVPGWPHPENQRPPVQYGGSSSSTDMLPLEATTNHSWWPVTAIMGPDGVPQVGERLAILHGTVCVVCVYQWGWPEPTGWWITSRPIR